MLCNTYVKALQEFSCADAVDAMRNDADIARSPPTDLHRRVASRYRPVVLVHARKGGQRRLEMRLRLRPARDAARSRDLHSHHISGKPQIAGT